MVAEADVRRLRGVTTATGRDGTGLLTDRYELTMLRSALASGVGRRAAAFEVFARRLPPGRRYGVVAGTGRFLDALAQFRFDPDELKFLLDTDVVDDRTARYLASYRFSGSVWGYPEGECYFPGSPILVIEGAFAEAVVLETLALSILNHDCAIASAASRMVTAAGQRPIIEMGSRRTHELAAVAAARAAYIAGFAASSNLRAGMDYGVPTTGTSAHSFTLAHDDERQAFATQLESLGAGTTLLVDTYDVATAVRTAVDLAGPALGAVRIDSGDLPVVARQVRAQLDSLGATATAIVVTGDLDEHSIAGLAVAPVDGYGVGTALVTGSGAPTAALVYKLAARSGESPAGTARAGADGAGAELDGAELDGAEPDRSEPDRSEPDRSERDGSGAGWEQLRPVAKRSPGKRGRGGRKWAARMLDQSGTAVAERISGAPLVSRPDQRPLLRQLVRDGEITGAEPLQAARDRHQQALRELPDHARRLADGGPAIPTIFNGLGPQDGPAGQ